MLRKSANLSRLIPIAFGVCLALKALKFHESESSESISYHSPNIIVLEKLFASHHTSLKKKPSTTLLRSLCPKITVTDQRKQAHSSLTKSFFFGLVNLQRIILSFHRALEINDFDHSVSCYFRNQRFVYIVLHILQEWRQRSKSLKKDETQLMLRITRPFHDHNII